MEVDGAAAGLIVDSVSEVLRLPAGSIEPSDALLRAADPRCLLGIGRIPGQNGAADKSGAADKNGTSERLLLLLDVAEVLTLQALPA